MRLQRILFPIDFSGSSAAMVPYVTDLAQRFNAKVTALHAFDLAPSYIALPPARGPESASTPLPFTPDFQKLRDDQQRELQRFARDQLQMVSYTTRVEDGEAAAVIEWVAQNEDTDLIMIATKGRGKFRRLLLGSITAKLLHDVSCAVFTSAHAPPAMMPFKGDRSVICAVELNSEAKVVVNAARLMAQAYGASVSLVHLEPTSSRREDVTDTSHWLQKALRETANGETMKPEVHWKIRVLSGGLAEGVRDAAIEEKAGLVVVGRGHQKERLSRMWSHLYDIIRESPCPVLSV